MAFQDQTLTCKDCEQPFTWTAGEQEFYQMKGFDNQPTRCPECRKKKKAQKFSDRRSFEITCSRCGQNGTVPFEPREGREVLCRDCFSKSKVA